MDELEQTETSVNNVEAADPQNQEETQETSENNSEVANPNPVQDVDTNAYYADMRRKQELDQYRQQAETYQQQLDRTAKLMGYSSHDEMMQALDDYEQQQKREQYEQAGIDPDLLNQAIENHPAVQFANQLQQKEQEDQRLASEWGELAQEFPGITPEQISPEVFQIQQERGLPLLDAYLRVNYKNMGQQAEQSAIQKIQNNAASSPGALGGGDVNHVTSVSKLSSSDFNSLVDQVLRGERKQL